MYTIELTEKEAQTLRRLITNAPLTGNFLTLPNTLRIMSNILGKLEGVLNEHTDSSEGTYDSEQDG